MIEAKLNPAVVFGEISLKHEKGFVFVDIEIPLASIGLPREQLLARYVEPAFAAALDIIRRKVAE